MATYRITAPDGGQYDVTAPDDATQEQVLAYAQQNYKTNDTPTSQPQKFGKDAYADTLRKTLQDAGWVDRNLAGIGSAAVNAWEGVKGLAGQTNNENVANQKIIAESAPVGNIVGNMALLAPTAAIPGANTVTGAATIGALTSSATTPGSAAERLKAGLMSGAGGAAGAKLSSMIGRIAPSEINANVKLLSKEGVSLTPGQNAGGMLKSFEDKATSVPILGNVINNARRRGIEDFNRSAIKRASLPGMQVEGVGQGAIQDLRQGLGAAYDDVLSRSSANALEPQYVQNMATLRSGVAALPEREARAFDNIIKREVSGRMAPNGMVNAENLQGVKSGLGNEITNFSTSSDAYQRQLGQALKQAEEEFRGLVSRANPKNASDLKAIDTAYANFKRLQRAASGVGAEEGVFTPAQLYSAVKALDRSKDNRAFSEGTALLQDLAAAGKDVMPSKIPDSGTAGRMMGNLFSLSGLTSTAGGAAAAIPAYVAYSRPGSAAINGMVNKSIPVKNALVNLIEENPDLLRTFGSSLPKLMSQ